MKKPVSKEDLRAELERATDSFLRQGGRVEQVPQGASGKNPGDPPLFLNRRLFIEPRTKRTLVPEVVAAIEARRKEKLRRNPGPKRKRLPQPRLRGIVEDCSSATTHRT